MFRPYDLRPTILITEYTLATFSTLVIAIRFYARKCIVGKLNWSDYIMALALIFTWGLCACNHFQLFFGSGVQGPTEVAPKPTQEERDAYWKYWLFGSAASWYAYHIGYLFIMGLIKLSILFFYLGFATQRTFRRLVKTSIVIITIINIYCIFIVAFQCPKAPSYALSPAILTDRGAGHCFDLRIVFYWQAGWSMGSDIIILLLPMPILFSLRMRKAKRLSVIAVFAVSLLIPIASGVRLLGLSLWANSGIHARYYGGYIIFWSQVEINTAIICASAPSIQPLFKRFLRKSPRYQSSHSPSYYYGGRHSLPGLSAVAANIERNLRRDSISILETPTPAYCPFRDGTNREAQSRIITAHNAEEEETRARIRALSSPTYPSLQPASPAFAYSVR